MRVTLKSIAAEAGLSHQTVSFVLGNKAHLFRPETQRRVRETARRLGYRPNASARAMRAGRFNTLALLLSTESNRSTLFSFFLVGAEAAAREQGQHLVLTAMPDQQLTDPEFAPRILGESMADGLLLNYYTRIPPEWVRLLARHRIPAIWTNARRKADCVHPDDFGAACSSTRQLIRNGHRRIAYLDATHAHPLDAEWDHYSAFDRLQGYRQAMLEADLPTIEFLPSEPVRGPELVQAMRQWLGSSDRPSAAVTCCDLEPIAILHAAPSLGLKLPDDLAIVTFCEQPFHYGLAPVTTRLIPSEKLGRLAVELLMRKISEPEVELAPHPVEFGVHMAG